jgi:Carboxypeptidase regulatory-like domain
MLSLKRPSSRLPALFLISVLPSLVLAQYTTATLSGVITDSSGRTMPRARVTIENTGTGLIRAYTTGEDGAYLFPALPVGTYRLQVEKEGFSHYRQEGITLNVNQTATQSVSLRVGEVRQQVNVYANAEMLPAETSNISQLVDTQRIVDLPLNGRQAQSLLFLVPGTINTTLYYCGSSCQGGVYPNAQWGNISGGGPGNINYQLDGADHNDHYINSNYPFPNPDSIQEFSVQTNNMSAEYGNSAVAVNVVTKSGDNQFHGNLFEFVRNGALNARNFFAQTADTQKRNQFGATAGGRIVRDKLFFFGSWQRTTIRTLTPTGIAFVPTAQERNGDFSDISTIIKDPATNQPFTGNQIPASRLSAPAQFFLQHIPLPNGPNGQLSFLGPSANETDQQFMPKIDYISGKHHLSGRYFYAKYSRPADLAAGKTNVLASDGNGVAVTVQTVAVNHTYIASPSLLFATWFSYDRSDGQSLSGAPFTFQDAGVNIVAPPGPPTMEGVGVNGFFFITPGHAGEFDRNNWQIREVVTANRGHHEFHFGGEIYHVGTPVQNTFQQSGFFSFGSAVTGNSLADFILGQGANFTQSGGIFFNYGGLEGSLFAQDNWRMNQKLVVNLGIRWEPYFPYTDTLNRIPCYRPGLHSQRYPNAPTGLVYAGDPGCPAGGTEGASSQFAPRFGFAYRIRQSTVIRGGAGFYYTLPNTDQINGFSSVAPFAPVFSLTNTSFADPYGTLGITNPFPGAFGGKSVPGPQATFSLPVRITGTFPTRYDLPTIGTWNLGIEQQLGSNWLLSLGYFGNRGYHLSSNAIGRRQLNPAIYIPGQSTAGNTQARRVDPNFSGVSLYPTDLNSRYQSFQVNLEKRLSNGFSVLANYTWSKAQDDTGPVVNPFDIHNFGWGNSTADLPNVFHLSAIWILPNAPVKGWVSNFINGWEITGIHSWQNGFRFTVYSGVDNSFSAVGSDRADFTGTHISQAVLGDRSHSQMVNQYFNTSLFTVNTIGTYGNAPRNLLTNPGLFNIDTAAIKYFPVSEGMKFQFRAEFFNVLNNVNFTVPGLGSANPNESAVGNIVGTGSFGKLTFAADPRILQFALKFIF